MTATASAMTALDPTTRPYVVRPGEGLDGPLARLGCVHKIPSAVTGGRLGIVEHTLPPRALAAPLHRHSREDELSYVIEGELGALLGDDAVVAGAGSYVLKPRDQWHTFWNAGDSELRFIELVIPGGFEGYFERLSPLLVAAGEPDLEAITALAVEYGLEFRPEETDAICERFGLTFA